MERAAETDNPRRASELVKQAADILALLTEATRMSERLSPPLQPK